MPYQPATSGLLGKLLYSGLPQWGATTGRTPTTGMVQGLLGADLYGAKKLAMDENLRQQELDIQRQYLQMAKDAEKRQKRSMRVSNVMGGLLAPLGMISAGKALGLGGGGLPTGPGTTSLSGIQSIQPLGGKQQFFSFDNLGMF